MNTEKIIKEKKGTIVDVRRKEEFESGNAIDSINIPLQEIQERLHELKNLKQPLVLCCASGVRSGRAAQYLKGQGFECFDGGSWLDIRRYQN